MLAGCEWVLEASRDQARHTRYLTRLQPSPSGGTPARAGISVMLRVAVLLAAIASSSAFIVQTAARASAPVRLSAPRAQFGTQNYDKDEREGFFLSPVPGAVKVRTAAALTTRRARRTGDDLFLPRPQGASGKSPFANANSELDSRLALPLLLAPIGLILLFLVALYFVGPGTKLPYDFLNGESLH